MKSHDQPRRSEDSDDKSNGRKGSTDDTPRNRLATADCKRILGSFPASSAARSIRSRAKLNSISACCRFPDSSQARPSRL